MWVFDSSSYALTSTAQRQFRFGLCSQLVFAMCVPFAWLQAHTLRHHGGYGSEGQFLRAQTCGDSTGAVLGQVIALA